jgi:hypothetical protein
MTEAFKCNPCECGGSDICTICNPTRPFNIGMFFEVTQTIHAVSLAHARQIADRWAEGIADSGDLTITHVEVIENE